MRTLLIVVAAFAMAAAPALDAAQQQPGPARRPGGARPQQRVDPLTASIRGRITTADTGAPVRTAEVRAMSDGGVTRLAATDRDGRFELRDLPAGAYRLSVSKSGFVPLQFGQRRPFEAAAVIALDEGERFTADVALPRGGAISGRVYDRFGEPVAGVRVNALRSRLVQGQRRLQSVGRGDETDDTGAFRVFGLAPGDYYVVARPTDAQARRDVMAGPLIFFPGTADASEAQRLTVGAGLEVDAVFQLVTVSASRVSGIVLDSSGTPVDANVTLASRSLGLGYVNAAAGEVPMMLSGHAGADGRFVIEGVPPGPYVLRANAFRIRTTTEPLSESASMPVVVTGQEVSGLTLALGRGGSITGTVVGDASAGQPLPSNLEVTARADGSFMHSRGPDNTFQVMGLTGPVRIGIDGLPEGWAVKAIVVNGEDVTDSPIEVKNGEAATARIVLTDRLTEVSGVIAPGERPLAHNVVVFADEPARWTYPSRYVRVVRTDSEGRFRIAGLPGDERYLAVAVDYLDEGESDDPEFLERMRAQATSFSLSDAEKKRIEPRVVPR